MTKTINSLEAPKSEDMQPRQFVRMLESCGRYVRHSYIVFALEFVSMACCCGAQQLQWESEDLVFTASPTDKAVVAHFKFKNTGDAEAKIASATSSCSCTTLALLKKNFASGESGELTATFSIGVRTGVQAKVIMVESNDLKHPRRVLRMKVTIPEIAQLRQTFLYWSPAEARVTKEIGVKIMNGVPVKTITVESSNSGVSATVETTKIGQEYRIVVTPRETDQSIMATLSIKTDYPPENPKIFSAIVRVQPKK